MSRKYLAALLLLAAVGGGATAYFTQSQDEVDTMSFVDQFEDAHPGIPGSYYRQLFQTPPESERIMAFRERGEALPRGVYLPTAFAEDALEQVVDGPAHYMPPPGIAPLIFMNEQARMDVLRLRYEAQELRVDAAASEMLAFWRACGDGVGSRSTETAKRLLTARLPSHEGPMEGRRFEVAGDDGRYLWGTANRPQPSAPEARLMFFDDRILWFMEDGCFGFFESKSGSAGAVPTAPTLKHTQRSLRSYGRRFLGEPVGLQGMLLHRGFDGLVPPEDASVTLGMRGTVRTMTWPSFAPGRMKPGSGAETARCYASMTERQDHSLVLRCAWQQGGYRFHEAHIFPEWSGGIGADVSPPSFHGLLVSIDPTPAGSVRESVEALAGSIFENVEEFASEAETWGEPHLQDAGTMVVGAIPGRRHRDGAIAWWVDGNSIGFAYEADTPPKEALSGLWALAPEETR